MIDEDLGALLAGAGRRITAEEQPILAAHDLTMWQYVVLNRLGHGDYRNQLALAGDIRYDKTRLIALLDALERRDLIVRTPDPADRRHRSVRLTDSGRSLLTGIRREIGEMEARLLARIDEGRIASVREVLRQLRDG